MLSVSLRSIITLNSSPSPSPSPFLSLPRFNTFLRAIQKHLFIAYLLLLVSVMMLSMAVDGRPISSRALPQLSPINSLSMEELTTIAPRPTLRVDATSFPTEDKIETINVLSNFEPFSTSFTPVQVLKQDDAKQSDTKRHNDSEFSLPETNEVKIHTSFRFQEQSRKAFLRLNSQPFVEAPLLPDEEQRQIWLEHHRKKKFEKKAKKNDLPGHKRIFALTSADIINNNQSCKGDLFKHKIRMAGCEPKIIINRFCHGSCASFYIPKLGYRKRKATFHSCAACVPSEHDLIQVKLDCPGRNEKEIYRTVMRVKKCACRNIEINYDNDNDDDNDDDDEGERDGSATSY